VLARLEAMVDERGRGDGRLPPERDLARQLGTSRATLREALRVLRLFGIVESSPKTGTRLAGPPVVPLSLIVKSVEHFGSPEQVMEARGVVEPGIAALAARRSLARDWPALAECVEAGRAAGSVPAFEHWDREFHRRIAHLSGNATLAYLSALLQGVREEVVWGTLKARDLAVEGRREAYLADHERVLRAIRERDPEAARHAMQEHLARVGASLLEGVRLAKQNAEAVNREQRDGTEWL
jgi:DNA-binding FadR family transcriptional regulator